MLWLRLLTHIFGVTTWAASTALAGFMAGLALGSFGAGRLVDRARSPLLWFGAAEALVGLAALATQPALKGVELAYLSVAPSFPDAIGPLTVLRFVLAFVVLVVPTTLMGASLPLVVKSSLLRSEGLGKRISLLYATNTAGAIAGTLLAGFLLIGSVGIGASFRLAAGLNLLVGLAAIPLSIVLARRSNAPLGAGDTSAAEPATAATNETPIPLGVRRAILAVFAVSGFASLALEVVWFRVLSLYLEVTTYAFTIMLAAVLAGIAAGSYAVTPLMHRKLNWLAVLAVLEIAIGLAAALSLAALTRAHDLATWLSALPFPFLRAGGERLLSPSASFLALFPTTFLLGVAFPIGLRLWASDGSPGSDRTGRHIGLFYSANVCGAIFGSIGAGFVLLPWLGSQRSLAAVAALSLLSGLVLVMMGQPTLRRLTLAAASLVGFALVAFTMPDPFGAALERRFAGESLLWREEGIQATVSVHQQPNGARMLYLDGMRQASDEPVTAFVHQMIGTLPMAVHSDPRDVLIVGLGGGVTAGAASSFGGSNVQVIELSDSVVRGADWFGHVNRDVVRRPNVHVRIDDGRNFMLLTPNRFDVVTADIIRPHTAGAGNLYSLEYFRLARNVLKDDGVMLQWVGGLPEAQHRAIMRTFIEVFPETTLWSQILLIGAKRPLQLAPADFERKMADPSSRAALAGIGVREFNDLVGLHRAGPDELADYVRNAILLTDDRPAMEYFLTLPRASSSELPAFMHGP